MVETAAAPAQPADVARLARGGTLNFAGAIVSAVANFALVLVVTHSLSTAAAGRFFAATSVFLLLVGVGRLGSGTGLIFFVARLRAVGEARRVDACLRVALWPVLGASLGLGLLLGVFASPLAELAVRGDPGETAGYLRALAAALPFAGLLEGVLGASRGFGRMQPTVLIEKTARPLAQVLGVTLAAVSGTATVLAIGWALPYLPAVVAAVVWLGVLRRREARPGAGEPAGVPVGAMPLKAGGTPLSRAYWRFTGPRAVSALVQVGLQRLDVVLVAALLGGSAAALYMAATRLVVLGSLGVQAIAMAVQPQVAGHYARGELSATNQLYRTSTAWLMLVTWPLYVVGIIFAPTVLLLFGSSYTHGSTAVTILCCATLLSTGCGVVDAMLTMAGKTAWILGNVTAALVVNVGLNVLLIPRLGIVGAAWAWAAAMAVNNLLPLTQLWRSARMSPFGAATGRAAVVSVAAFGVVGGLARVLFGQGLAALVLTAVGGGVLYLLLLWRGRSVLHLDTLVASLRARVGRPAAVQR